jgi:hypothetical protein
VILRPYIRIVIQFVRNEDDRLSDEMIETSRTCIDAAIHSTIAFDRVGAAPNSNYVHFDAGSRIHRLMVTNIFGTTHA